MNENKSFIEELKQRNNIVEVAQELIPEIKKVGANWVGTIRSEKTPALTIYPANQSWCHFAGDTTPSGKNGGDVINLIEYINNCSSREAITFLAKRVGMEIKSVIPEEQKQLKENKKAQEIWENASEAPLDFPYLKKKGILPHGIRFLENKLVLSIYNSDNVLSSLQFIDTNGEKRFFAGATISGCFFLIGTPVGRLCITEGFATGASVFESTGYAVAVAFSSTNLKSTAEEIQKKFPNIEIIICADTDSKGMLKAREAIEKIGGRLAIPKFNDEELLNEKEPTDFNDLFLIRGSSAVKEAIESAEIVREKFGFTSLNSLINEPDEEISWIVDGLLPSGGFSVMVAKPKVGKSTLARQLALNVAQGENFIGRETTKGTVLYVALEEKRSEVKKHFKLLGATGNEDLHSYIGSVPQEANQWLEKEVKNRKPVLVIVDTLFRFAQVSDVNDYAKVNTALSPLLALARDNNTHLMVIHHARKGGGEGGDSTLGSTAIFGSVDTSIILKRKEEKRTIETQQRYGKDIESTLLVFDEVSRSIELGDTKETDDLKKIEDEILDFLKINNEPVNEPTICDEIEGRTSMKRKALRDLFNKGDIQRSGAGKRNDPFLYSCSLVPSIYVGLEKQETKSEENPDYSNAISCSKDSDKKGSLGVASKLDEFVACLKSDKEPLKVEELSNKGVNPNPLQD